MDRKATFNPVAHRRVALLFDPVVKSGILLYSYIFYIFLKLFGVRFNVYELARTSTLVTALKLEGSPRHLVLLTYAVQFTLFTLLSLSLVKYVAGGSALSRRMLKDTDLSNKVALVTGGYSGIGYETVLQLLKWNCRVVICGRNKTKATNAIERLKQTNSFNPNNLFFIQMDLDDLLSVKLASQAFLKQFDRLDFLVNNAGIWAQSLKLTNYKLESQFSSNFLGHFYLTHLLLDTVKKSAGRIINVSSIAHFKYDPATDPIFTTKSTDRLKQTFSNSYYGRSKLFNVWFTHAMHRKLKEERSNVMCVSLAPGVINTPLLWPLQRAQFYLVPKYLNLLIVRTPKQGAQTTLFLCCSDKRDLVSGAHYDNMKMALVSKHAHDPKREEQLYNLAQEMVNSIVK